MALYKKIIQENGIPIEYHRILYINITTNSHNSIAVVSYINEEQREKELNGEIENPYKVAVTFECDYDDHMDIEKAYEYLKTMDAFKDAVEI